RALPVEAQAFLCRRGNLQCIVRVRAWSVGDRQHAHDRMLAFADQGEHDRAGAVLGAFLPTCACLRFPEISVANDQTWPGDRQAHGHQSFSSASRWLYSAGTSDVAMRAISASVKSSSRTTRRSRRLRRSYSSTDMRTRRSRPLRVIVTGSVRALSAREPNCFW